MATTHTQGDLNAIPHLPGFNYKRKPKNFSKAQTFNYCNGLPIEQKEGVTYERAKLVTLQKGTETRRLGLMGQTSAMEAYGAPVEMTHTEYPAWDVLDRHVLRFYGYFKEAVIETNLENYRVRQCKIYYYLEDDTCQVNEEKVVNSGMQGGQLIRRHRFPGMDGGYLRWDQLQVGDDLQIYGRNIRIRDCDAWTRDYYNHQGLHQGMPEPAEQDAFTISSMSRANVSAGIPKTAERQYREIMLGGGHVNTDMQQFLEWDRKVLRFNAVMDDLTNPQFERRPFDILFFLADDTVEIREKYPLNSGRDNFPIFFRRGKMPRGAVQVLGPLVPAKKKEDMVSATDLAVGQECQLLGYKFYIYDADDFTRQYFEGELGCTLAERQDVRLPERAVPRPPTPPYTGYGSWDDSMGSVLQLVPSKPRKDMKKLIKYDGQILRFTAKFQDAKPEDADRMLVVNYHLFDDTVSIHEPPVRNAGIITGQFMEKAIHLNQVTGELFKREDMFKGNVIKIYNRAFKLLDCDEYTRKFIQDGGIRRNYDLQGVLENIRESMKQLFPLVRDVFRTMDLDHDGVLTYDEFKLGLEKWGFQLAPEDVIILMKHFDTREDGQVSYNEFCDQLLDEDYTDKMMKLKPPLKKDFDPAYAARVMQKSEERVETEQVRAAVRRLSDLIYKQIHTFTKLFKEFGRMTHEPTVTIRQIQEALQAQGHFFQLEDLSRVLLFVLPAVDLAKVNYVDFLKAMTTCYHDMSHIR